MKLYHNKQGWMVAGALAVWLADPGALAAEPAKWTGEVRDGRIEARHGNTLMLAWQSTPLANPIGGDKFKGSAFLHPLCTPSGFQWTDSQPADHKHHFGLWWPWKFIEMDGVRYNCWEIQQGQGGHVARNVKPLAGSPDQLEWEFQNEVVIKKPGEPPFTAIHETARVGLALSGADAVVIDVALRQRAAEHPVMIIEYLYSGFPGVVPAHGTRTTAASRPARAMVATTPTAPRRAGWCAAGPLLTVRLQCC